MSLRTYSVAFLLGLSGCRDASENPVTTASESNRLACATGTDALSMACAMERDGSLVTVRHQDGSFRRFEIDTQGQFSSADGAEQVTGIRRQDGSVDVWLNEAHYRFAAAQLQP